MTWIPSELHAHTLHSDGRLTVSGMAREMHDLGFKAVALTDHNTTSGLPEITDAERETGVRIIPGMELTTFHGHLVSLGTASYVEWRSLTRSDIQSALDAIHAFGGLAGVAHPFNPGNPFCTGCFWDYDSPCWNHVDYLEVWSEPDPWRRPKNGRSLRLWNSLLDAGFRIPAVGAQDFHSPDRDCVPAVTYLGVAGNPDAGGFDVAALKDALAQGRVFVTLGPLLSITARARETDHGPGDTVSLEKTGAPLQVSVGWDVDERTPLWESRIETLGVEVRGNQGVLARCRVESAQGVAAFTVNTQGCRWIRAELHGRARGQEAMIAFTSPVYLEE